MLYLKHGLFNFACACVFMPMKFIIDIKIPINGILFERRIINLYIVINDVLTLVEWDVHDNIHCVFLI